MAIARPSGWNLATDTGEKKSSKLNTLVDRSTSHSRTVLSSDALTTHRPFGEKSPQFTQLVCPLNVDRNLPSGVDQIFSVLSCDADTRFLPSGEKRTERTAAPCAFSTLGVYRPTVLGVHSRTVRSLEPLAIHSPCGEYATDSTESLCPAKR